MTRGPKPLRTLLYCFFTLFSEKLVWCLCKTGDCALPHPQPPCRASDLCVSPLHPSLHHYTRCMCNELYRPVNLRRIYLPRRSTAKPQPSSLCALLQQPSLLPLMYLGLSLSSPLHLLLSVA